MKLRSDTRPWKIVHGSILQTFPGSGYGCRTEVALGGDAGVGGVGVVAEGVAGVEQGVVLERSSNSRDRVEAMLSGLASRAYPYWRA
ncbi:hypothetical protein GY45DRAFT_1329838 [Cubamyces sp. BRFM 1775]|nr:hypothetical protein GY45DRAFT_1329838 [Cubamyces sp. BRFM 1775]